MGASEQQTHSATPATPAADMTPATTARESRAQEVRLTLDDGRVLKFTGPAQVKASEQDLIRVVGIEFSSPYLLPEGMTWSTLQTLAKQQAVLVPDRHSTEHGTELQSDA